MNKMKMYATFLIVPAIIISLVGFSVPRYAQAATTITTCLGLRDIDNDLDGDYVLGNDIDCSGIADWAPLGTFTGKLDGAGFAIQHLTVGGYVNGNAFFGNLNGAKVYNLSFTDADVETNFVGGVLATTATNDTKIVNVHVEALLTSGAAISITGGIVGALSDSHIYYSSANVDLVGYQYLGGLVGKADPDSTIQYSYATGVVTTGTVGSDTYTGGLVGQTEDAVISNSYSQVELNAATNLKIAGGLVGNNVGESSIIKSYSTGNVQAGGTDLGGLVGKDEGTLSVESSFWDTETSGQATSVGGTGKTTAEMKTESTFTDANWGFPDIWDIDPGQYPTLVPYDDTPGVLTEISQIQPRATYSDIAYVFDADIIGDHTYFVTPCGGISEPLVGENAGGHMEVQLQQAEIGSTYTCEVYTVNLTDIESNHLTIGPFTVISGTRSGSITKKVNLPIPNQQTPALTPEQQIATPTLGVSSLLTRNLYFGLRGSDVKQLQQYLNANGFPLASSGPGSPGQETELFGMLTRNAVIRYQKSKGISPSVGYVGPITRRSINGQ